MVAYWNVTPVHVNRIVYKVYCDLHRLHVYLYIRVKSLQRWNLLWSILSEEQQACPSYPLVLRKT